MLFERALQTASQSFPLTRVAAIPSIIRFGTLLLISQWLMPAQHSRLVLCERRLALHTAYFVEQERKLKDV